MRQQPIIDRLDGLGFRYRGGALEFAALPGQPGQLPQAYVMPDAEAAADNRLASGAIDQRVTFDFSIVLIVDAAGRQDRVSELLDDLAKQVRERIAGWQHPEASTPTAYRGGQLVSVDGSAVSWAVRFRTAYHYRKVG